MVKRKVAEVAVTGAEVDDVPRLSVFIDEDGIPRYQFTGMWNVREILKVERTLGRKYREYMKLLRRPQPTIGG